MDAQRQQQAVSKYLPSAAKILKSVGLSLSGGGYRATLFHLGALRRLNEFGILPRLTTISSVSGGSILNGFLASRLRAPLTNGIAGFQDDVSRPMREFCALDIRKLTALEVAIPRTHNSLALAKRYDQHLTSGKLLKDIPSTPTHVFCSTDLSFSASLIFSSGPAHSGFGIFNGGTFAMPRSESTLPNCFLNHYFQPRTCKIVPSEDHYLAANLLSLKVSQMSELALLKSPFILSATTRIAIYSRGISIWRFLKTEQSRSPHFHVVTRRF